MTEPERPAGQLDAPATSRYRAIATVVLGLAGSGAFVGALWAWIAPPAHAVVAVARSGERVHEYLGAESQNFFVAPVLLLGLLGVVAVVSSVLVWQWREHRGPEMVIGLCVGLIAAAAVAAGVGALLVRMRYGALDFDTVTLANGDHSVTYVRQAPPVFFARDELLVAATLLSPAATASLVYALIAAGSARDDLGAYPPAGPPGGPGGPPSKPSTQTPSAPEPSVS
ncbi:DUF2567 domain-containing protein [Mycobacterium intermedium]|uniref:DUF2567 domain-containing protein n=1 Tax=Mycobacterium intermedium TaxID=28445 RepID=UPI0018D2E0BA|nr:DUF2567 domain-containing protein [Mycobacterium intermedium]